MVQQWAAAVSGNDITVGENFRIDAISGLKFSELFADLETSLRILVSS